MPLDEQIAEKIRKSGTNAVLAVNKSDIPEHDTRISDFCKLGFASVCPISAEHGRGMDELWQAIEFYLGELKDEEPAEEISAEEKSSEETPSEEVRQETDK